MSNLLNTFYSNLNDLVSINADDITSETATINTLTVNNLSAGTIVLPNGYVDLSSNQTISGLKRFLNDIRFDSGLILSDSLNLSNDNLQRIQWLSDTTSSVQQQINSINTAITNISYTAGTQTTKIASSYLWHSGSGAFRLDGSLILNTGLLQISNSTCQSIQYLTNLNQNVQTALTSLQTKTTAQSYNSATSTTTFTSSYLVGNFLHAQSHFRLDGALYLTSGTLYLPQSTLVCIQYLSGLSSNVNTNITALQTKTTNQSYSGGQTIFSGTTTCSLLAFTTSINSVSKNTFDSVMTFCSTLTQNVETELNALKLKTTNISFNSLTNITTISNNVNIQSLTVSSAINGFSKFDFENAINFSQTLTSDAQTQINSISTSLVATDAVVAGNSGAIVVLNTITIPAIQAGILANGTAITDLQNRTTGLEQKTTQQSYSTALNKTSFGGTLQANAFQFSSLTSGFTQTANQDIILIGNTRIRNTLFLENGFGINMEGGVIQTLNNSTNSFASQMTLGSTLTVNGSSLFNNDVTIIGTKNLIVKNIIPLTFEDILFGSSSGHETDNAIFNMQLRANQPVSIYNSFQMGTNLSRYSYGSYNTTFGVDANQSITLNTPVLNLSGSQVNCNNLNSANAMNLNANTINIGTNQGVSAFNGINIGNVSSLSVINLNGVVYSPFAFNVTGSVFQW